MKRIFFILCAFLIAQCTYAQAVEPEQPDTISGIAVILQAGGTMTFDSVCNKLQFTTDNTGILVPVRAICVRTPVDMVAASMRGDGVGYVTRFYRKETGKEIPANDVLMFKIRDDDPKK